VHHALDSRSNSINPLQVGRVTSFEALKNYARVGFHVPSSGSALRHQHRWYRRRLNRRRHRSVLARLSWRG
jgi:hypothetical protein